MARFDFSALAEADLLDIGVYSVRVWGAEQAARYLAKLQRSCELLAENPQLGRPCDDIRPGLRRMEHAKHVVCYRQKPGGVLICRILHQRVLPEYQDMEEGLSQPRRPESFLLRSGC